MALVNHVMILAVFVAGSFAQFNPTLTIDSCTKSSLVLTLADAETNGIVYIQGQGASCKQTTSTGSNQHTFDFVSCNIQWEESFKVVIQKKSLYQTGEDKQIPIMCVADLADLTLTNNLNAADKDDDAGQNKTVKPTATMTLYKDGGDVGGLTVKLTDTVTMEIKLDTDYIEDFDIKARDCTASTIDIIQTYCAADTDLFPEFTHVSQGIISSTFGAFRTTELNGGSVPMTFSCTLQVCLGSCTATSCASGNSGWGRKKREANIVKRQATDDNSGVEDINVGAMIEISTEEVVIGGKETEEDFCLNIGAFVAIMLFMCGGLVASGVSAGIMTKKVVSKGKLLNQIGGLSSGY